MLTVERRLVCVSFATCDHVMVIMILIGNVFDACTRTLMLTTAVRTAIVCVLRRSPTRSVRPIGVGQPYAPPPPLTARKPSLQEDASTFSEYIGRVPTLTLKKALVGCYQVHLVV
jgi:hypothetical protein